MLSHLGCLKDLHTIVAAIADIEQTVVGQLGAVNRAAEEFRFHIASLEISWPGASSLAGLLTTFIFTYHRVLSVSAKMPDVLPGRRVNNEHAPIPITVSNVHEVRLGINDHVGRPVRLGSLIDAPVGIVAVRPLRACGADLINERAVRLELQDLRIVAEVRRPWKLTMEITGLAIASEIDKVVLINVDSVLTRRPDATVLHAALSLQEARITWTAP